MNEDELRKEAEGYAKEQLPFPKDVYDMVELELHKVDYLIAKLLGKNPYECFCNENFSTKKIGEKNICPNCEKPVN